MVTTKPMTVSYGWVKRVAESMSGRVDLIQYSNGVRAEIFKPSADEPEGGVFFPGVTLETITDESIGS